MAKRAGAVWMKAFPEQAEKLHPENSPAGGIKVRSESEEVRMAVYNAIRGLYLAAHPKCECCSTVYPQGHVRVAVDIHHTHGKEGWLLVDIRWWKSACRRCHAFIHEHPEQARVMGLIAEQGQWNNL